VFAFDLMRLDGADLTGLPAKAVRRPAKSGAPVAAGKTSSASITADWHGVQARASAGRANRFVQT
jgi:hypothetical protein